MTDDDWESLTPKHREALGEWVAAATAEYGARFRLVAIYGQPSAELLNEAYRRFSDGL